MNRRPLDREGLAFALLFSLPVGAGVALGTMKATAGRDLPLVAATGLLAAAAVFALVVGGVVLGDDDSDGSGEGRRRAE